MAKLRMVRLNQDEAIRRALQEVKARGSAIAREPPTATFKEGGMRPGDNRSGWLVVFRLDVPEGFTPNLLHVEIYEPDGEVCVPPAM